MWSECREALQGGCGQEEEQMTQCHPDARGIPYWCICRIKSERLVQRISKICSVVHTVSLLSCGQIACPFRNRQESGEEAWYLPILKRKRKRSATDAVSLLFHLQYGTGVVQNIETQLLDLAGEILTKWGTFHVFFGVRVKRGVTKTRTPWSGKHLFGGACFKYQ